MTTGTDWANVGLKFLDFVFKNMKTAIPLWFILGGGIGAWVSSPSEAPVGEISIGEVQNIPKPHKHPDNPHTHPEYALKHTHECPCTLDELIKDNDGR